MTTDDRLLNCTSSESPNKSSGDIGERTWTPEQFLEYLEAFVGEFECNQIKTMMSERGLAIVSAAEIERLRREVEEANRFWNERCVQTSVNAHGWMQAHDQLLGFIQSRPDLLKVMMAEKFEIKYPAPADTPTLLQRALTAESAVAAAWEEAARVAKDRWREWRSSYEDDLDGMDACEDISKAISARASAIRAAVSKNTAESGHSPSTMERD